MVRNVTVTPIVGVCNCSMFCCMLLYVHSSIATILMGKRELIALLNLSSWCLVVVERLFLAVPRGCLPFLIVVFPDHTHILSFYGRRRRRPLAPNIYYGMGRYVRLGLAMLGRHWLGQVIVGKVRLCRH